MPKEQIGPNNQPEGRGLSRRKFLKFLLGTGLLAGLVKILLTPKKEKHEERKESQEQRIARLIRKRLERINSLLESIEANNEPIESIPEVLQPYSKNNEKLFPLFKICLKSRNPPGALKELWQNKVETAQKEVKDNKELEKFRQAVLKYYSSLPPGFINPNKLPFNFIIPPERRTPFDIYYRYSYLAIEESLLILNWKKLLDDSRFNFQPETKEFIIRLFLQPTKKYKSSILNLLTKTLVSITLIEIGWFEDDISLNKTWLEYLLQSFGLSFICSLPSLADKIKSFGPFQLSEYVIGDKKELFYPINFMNNFVGWQIDNIVVRGENYSLPKTIDNLKGRQHFRAETFLLLYRLLELFKKLEEIEVWKKLEPIIEPSDTPQGEELRNWLEKQFYYFLLGAHHLPSANLNSFIAFLKHALEQEQKPDFYDWLKQQDGDKRLIAYLQKGEKCYSLY